jgi:hypothetical protein
MSIPLRNFGKTGARISALGFGGNHLGAGRVHPSFSGSIQLSPHLHLNPAMNMNSGTGTGIRRMFHMSSVVD